MTVAKRFLSDDALSSALSEKGLKITPQRMAVYRALLDAGHHPSAEDVYSNVRKSLPHISFDTVYRTLLSFTELDIIWLAAGGDEKMRFDSNLHPHHHFRCVKCQSITDFESKACDALPLPKSLGHYFKVQARRIVLEGLCPKCAKPVSGKGTA